MIPALAIVAVLILASAALAMALRNLIYSALLLVGTWAGIACFYLWAGAEFVAFAQLLIYVGAVSMVVLFAVLLTQRSHTGHIVPPAPIERVIGAIFAGGAVAGVLVGAVMSTNFSKISTAAAPTLTVRQLGEQLMGQHAAAVLIVGVILTVALIGATILAAGEKTEDSSALPGPGGRSLLAGDGALHPLLVQPSPASRLLPSGPQSANTPENSAP